MSSPLLDKKMNRESDELNYMGCNIFREGQPLVRRHDELSATHALAKPTLLSEHDRARKRCLTFRFRRTPLYVPVFRACMMQAAAHSALRNGPWRAAVEHVRCRRDLRAGVTKARSSGIGFGLTVLRP